MSKPVLTLCSVCTEECWYSFVMHAHALCWWVKAKPLSRPIICAAFKTTSDVSVGSVPELAKASPDSYWVHFPNKIFYCICFRFFSGNFKGPYLMQRFNKLQNGCQPQLSLYILWADLWEHGQIRHARVNINVAIGFHISEWLWIKR